MLIVKYSCGLRGQLFEAILPSGKNKLKDLRSLISQEIRIKPHLISISQKDKVFENENEIINSIEFYQVNVISELKLFNFLITSEGGKFFECTLEENDLVQDLIDQVDQFLAQILKEKFDTYNLEYQNNQINYQDNRKSVIGDIFKENNIQLQIKLVHEVLTLRLLDNNDVSKDIEINRNQTLLNLKELIRPNLINFKIIINGKFPAQNFDERLIKDVFQHNDTIVIVQVQELDK